MQHIQNAAARLLFNLPKFSHVTPLFWHLHWLPVGACIRFKKMVRHHYGQAKFDHQSHNSFFLFWPSGGTSSLPMSGPQSGSQASARDSRLNCSEFTWTLQSHPLLPLQLTYSMMYVLVLNVRSYCMFYVLALKDST